MPAGGGKTTRVKELCFKFPGKKILYTSFTISVIKDFKNGSRKLSHVTPQSIDSIFYQMYKLALKKNPIILRDFENNKSSQFKSNSIRKNIHNESKSIRKFYESSRIRTNIELLCNHKMVEKDIEYIETKNMYDDMVKENIFTYTMLRYFCFENKLYIQYFKYKKNNYDIIFVDEAQDCKEIFVYMILKTNISVIFVGDKNQDIFDFQNTFNVFKSVLKIKNINTNITWRYGKSICKFIYKHIYNRKIESKCNYNTQILYDKTIPENEKYTHLFNTNENIIREAIRLLKNNNNIYIHGYKKHEKKWTNLTNFIKTSHIHIHKDRYMKKKNRIHLSTVHTFKGREADIIKVNEDIKCSRKNLFYVAVTRVRKKLYISKKNFTNYKKRIY